MAYRAEQHGVDDPWWTPARVHALRSGWESGELPSLIARSLKITGEQVRAKALALGLQARRERCYGPKMKRAKLAPGDAGEEATPRRFKPGAACCPDLVYVPGEGLKACAETVTRRVPEDPQYCVAHRGRVQPLTRSPMWRGGPGADVAGVHSTSKPTGKGRG